jgi:hypothetical protein
VSRPRHFDLPLSDAADRRRVASILVASVALSIACAAAGIVKVLSAAAI